MDRDRRQRLLLRGLHPEAAAGEGEEVSKRKALAVIAGFWLSVLIGSEMGGTAEGRIFCGLVAGAAYVGSAFVFLELTVE